ncbi:hypothetical protein C8R41DRAFT_870669 [Lentinula lateritia]|uniref:Zn(2)-C6 fungal-type domain-containing protein n=1 Tax=Lentinula lateritia TaxID=40482 RepID=A0ABQ8V429_9AGAR|nr:hypothetical protein C8R41DRAFT_870669 [Lentinula lateritia]
MMTCRTTTTTIPQPTASTSSRPADSPSPSIPADEDEDSIMRDALARVERVKAWKAEGEGVEGRGGLKQNTDVAEQRRLLAEAATARSQRGTSPSEMSVSPWRLVVEIRKEKGKGREKVQEQPVGGDPDDGDDDDDDDEREPCERCKAKKIPCLQQAGKRNSVICAVLLLGPAIDGETRRQFR